MSPNIIEIRGSPTPVPIAARVPIVMNTFSLQEIKEKSLKKEIGGAYGYYFYSFFTFEC